MGAFQNPRVLILDPRFGLGQAQTEPRLANAEIQVSARKLKAAHSTQHGACIQRKIFTNKLRRIWKFGGLGSSSVKRVCGGPIILQYNHHSIVKQFHCPKVRERLWLTSCRRNRFCVAFQRFRVTSRIHVNLYIAGQLSEMQKSGHEVAASRNEGH